MPELVQAVDRFLASPALADHTRRAYGIDVREFADWLERRGAALDDVDARILAAYAADLGARRPKLAQTTVARKLAAGRSVLRASLGAARVPRPLPAGPGRGRPEAGEAAGGGKAGGGAPFLGSPPGARRGPRARPGAPPRPAPPRRPEAAGGGRRARRARRGPPAPASESRAL